MRNWFGAPSSSQGGGKNTRKQKAKPFTVAYNRGGLLGRFLLGEGAHGRFLLGVVGSCRHRCWRKWAKGEWKIIPANFFVLRRDTAWLLSRVKPFSWNLVKKPGSCLRQVGQIINLQVGIS
ncbi:hypothetical protein BRADI_2g03905v3 [Brachypodium distachyon]|uniref:Uncharacterized protein n=1 Tax=Brachypodium distachyon TaxID=15368 RepID=A0A2K2D6R6_BRADI|nr:hypothetical protein BRADI_2g03905v3 [Brachypodium distachyon]